MLEGLDVSEVMLIDCDMSLIYCHYIRLSVLFSILLRCSGTARKYLLSFARCFQAVITVVNQRKTSQVLMYLSVVVQEYISENSQPMIYRHRLFS